MTPINMPQVGQDLETARIVKWHKQEGDHVKQGDVVASVESDKATFDVEASASGVLLQRLYQEGDEGAVFKPIAFVGEPGESTASSAAFGTPEGAGVPANGGERAAAASAAPPVSFHGRIFSSPSARKRAKELGVELEGLQGTGPRGRILRKDVEGAAAHPLHPAAGAIDPPVFAAASAGRETPRPAAAAVVPAAPAAGVSPQVLAEDQVVPFSRMRRIIAERLTASKQQVPHFYLFQDVDMEEALLWRQAFNQVKSTRVTVTDLVVQAAARALRKHPRVNAHVQADRLVVKARVNIGVATAVEDGLMVPVVADADRLDIGSLSGQIRRKAEGARQGRLDMDAKGTFTVTSLGMYGTSRFLPIINPPECAILGVGAAEPKVVACKGMIGIRRVMTLTLSADHRAIGGAEAAEFLKDVRERLESDYRLER